MNAALLIALSAVSATVHVDDYLDPLEFYQHDAIKRAAQAAGVYGEVLFTAGSEYVIQQQVNVLAGQTWRTDGTELATIRRGDMATTTLLADATAGSTFMQVADPSVFEDDWYVSPVSGAGGEKDGQLQATAIRSISNNTLELYRPLSNDYLAGSTVVNTVRMIQMSYGSTLESLRIDGNAAGNDAFVSWRQHSDIIIPATSFYSTVRDVEIVDSQGTAILTFSGKVVVENSLIQGANLAAVHLGGGTGLEWIDNQIIATNQQWERGGHSSGAITVSNGNHSVLISGGSISDVPTWAIGSLHPQVNNGFLVEGVLFENNEGVLDALSIVNGDPVQPMNLEFAGNIVNDSGELHMRGKNGDVIAGVIVRDNLFIASGIYLEDVTGLQLWRNALSEGSWLELDNAVFGQFSVADVDDDGDVDTADLTAMIVAYSGVGMPAVGPGDTDGDGDVDTADLTTAFQEFTGALSPPALPVPEPSGFVPLLLGMVGLLSIGYRRKRKT